MLDATAILGVKKMRNISMGLNSIFMNKLLVSLPIVILCFGIVSNALNTLIFAKKRMRSSPTLRFLLYLSIADIFVLIMAIIEILFKSDFSLGLRESSLFVCNIQKFLSYSSTYISSCLSMTVNICRALIISYVPTRFRRKRFGKKTVRFKKNILTKSFVDKTMILIVICVFLLNSHFIFLLKPSYAVAYNNQDFLRINDNKTNASKYEYDLFKCVPIGNSLYEAFLVHAWFWIDLFIFSIGPFASMSICSGIIIANLLRLNQDISNRLDSNSNRFKKRVYSRKLRKNTQISFMLISSNLYFLITMCLFWIWFLDANRHQKESFATHLKQSFIYTLLYSNNAFQILFYALFSSQYRREFCNLYGCKLICDELMLNSFVEGGQFVLDRSSKEPTIT